MNNKLIVNDINKNNVVDGLYLTSLRNFTNKEFTKSNNFLHTFSKDLGLRETKLINVICYAFSTYSKMTKNHQRNRNLFYETFEKEGFFDFNYQTLLELMEITNKGIKIEEFSDIVSNVMNIKFKYLKFEDENDTGTRCQAYFIVGFDIKKRNDIVNGNTVKNSSIRIHINKNFCKDLFDFTKIGYTTLDVDMNKIKSKMGLGIYEELKRITPLRQIKKKINDNYSVSNKFKQIHSYSLEEMNDICCTEFKYLAHLKARLEIQYKQLINKNFVNDCYKFHVNSKTKKLEIEIIRFDNDFDKLDKNEEIIF